MKQLQRWTTVFIVGLATWLNRFDVIPALLLIAIWIEAMEIADRHG